MNFKIFFVLCVINILNLLISIHGFKTEKPNVILIVTDDQDVVLNGLNPMRKTLKHLADFGVTAINAFTSSPICCPSRASILTGMYAHNHATINNSISGGCYDNFWKEVIEKNTLPVLMNDNGYDTFFAGKYLNEYKSNDVPKGWTNWFGLYGNSKYYNYTLNENGQPKYYENEYLTDVMSNLAVDYLEKHKAKDNTPFFMMLAPPAPHAPFTAADRHNKEFLDLNAPRTVNFDTSSGILDKHWLLRMPPKNLPENVIDTIDLFYRKRWQSLLAVDELVDTIIETLTKNQQLDSTFIIFTSDNGYHLGQFGQPFDKRQPYETDIRIPLIFRGPNLKSKTTLQYPVALIDLAPTILDFVGVEIPLSIDGESVKSRLINAEYEKDDKFDRMILIEYWGEGTDETYNSECPWPKNAHLSQCTLDADCKCQDAQNNTYFCLRHLSQIHNKIYCEFHDQEEFVEAYDLNLDPYQLENQGFEWPPSERARYSLILEDMLECIGKTCSNIPKKNIKYA